MARKVCVVITARPSYSRVRTVLEGLKKHRDVELQIVVAASALLDRYGDAAEVIQQEGFSIGARVYSVVEGETPTAMAKTTGLELFELAGVFDNLAPDVVLTIGDRFETIATAIAASYMNVPVAHVMGGEVTGSIDEKVRHATTKLADLHFVATRRAALRVRQMGEAEDAIYWTGCPSVDLAADILGAPELDFDPYAKYGGVGPTRCLAAGYLVVMQHPVTTEHDQAARHIEETLHAVWESGLPALWFWPNVDAGSDGTSRGIRKFRELHVPGNIHFFKNMSPLDFLRLLKNCRCLVGNSSVGIRECAFLGVPVVNIGSRQSDRERGPNVVDVDYGRAAIADAIRHQADHGTYPQDDLYGDGRAGSRIARLLATEPLASAKRFVDLQQPDLPADQRPGKLKIHRAA